MPVALARPASDCWRRRLRKLVGLSTAVGLVLLAPFLAFLKYHEYSYGRPEILTCLAVLAVVSLGLGALAATRPYLEVLVLAAVLAFFVDVQIPAFWIYGIGKTYVLAAGTIAVALGLWPLRAHAARVIALIAATILISTILIPTGRAHKRAGAASVNRRGRPLIVHVILDEHVGIEGFPATGPMAKLKADLRAFYEGQGFRVFGGAYSEHGKTESSLAHLLNFVVGRYAATLVSAGESGFDFGLARNDYFAQKLREGYGLRVYQTSHFELCPDGQSVMCDTYPPTGIGVLQGLPFDVSMKLRLVAGAYLQRSTLYTSLKKRYDALRRPLSRAGIRLPGWNWYYRMGALNSLAEADRLIRDLSTATSGELFFAHLIVPHHPYFYDSACTLQPPDRWMAPAFANAPTKMETREARYAYYEPQVRCTMHIVRRIVEAIPNDLRKEATIIIQGDHGSRLWAVPPHASRVNELSISDYQDSYSTLFAVRSPGLGTAYDSQVTPITCLLKSLVSSGFRSMEGVAGCVPAPTVFMEDRPGRFVPKPLPLFAPAGR